MQNSTILRRRISDISESTEDFVIDTVSTETIQPQKQKRKSGKEKEKKDKREITKAEKFAVIEQVRLWDVIWDIHHESYHNKDEHRKAYERVRESLLKEKIEMTVDEIKTVFNNLRTQYNAERNKEKASATKSGAGAEQTYTSRWEYLNSLVFLDDNIRARRSRSSLDVSEFTTPPTTATSSKTKRKVDTTDRLMERAVSTIESLAKSPKKSPRKSKKSSDAAFGEFVALRLEEIKHKDIKNELLSEICAAIFAAASRDADRE